MFFLKRLEHTIQLHPSFFGASMQEYLQKELKTEVEGKCSGTIGYIVRVLVIHTIGEGIILAGGDGKAEFNMEYTALVMKPFKGEVVDALVTNVNKMGFFASVGPLSIFTSTHLLPLEFKFQPDSNPPEFAAPDGQSIVKNKKVRLRIVGTRVDESEIFAIGSCKEDYVGVVDG